MSRHEGGLGCASLLCRIQCKGFSEGSSFCLVLWVFSMIVQFWLQCKVIPPLAAAKMWLFSHTLSRSRQHCWSLRGQCAAGGDEAPGLKGSDWWRVSSFRAVHQWKATRCLCIPLHLSNLITTVLDLKKKSTALIWCCHVNHCYGNHYEQIGERSSLSLFQKVKNMKRDFVDTFFTCVFS